MFALRVMNLIVLCCLSATVDICMLDVFIKHLQFTRPAVSCATVVQTVTHNFTFSLVTLVRIMKNKPILRKKLY